MANRSHLRIDRRNGRFAGTFMIRWRLGGVRM
jgi:hypothetical protein